jgi:hypothetical protein
VISWFQAFAFKWVNLCRYTTSFLDAVLKGGKKVKKLNYRLFCNAIPTIGSQAMPRKKFGERWGCTS